MAYRNYYRNDPHWIVVRYNGTCKCCGRTIRKNEQAFYYPTGKAMYCSDADCGQIEAARFESYAMDEAMMSGGHL